MDSVLHAKSRGLNFILRTVEPIKTFKSMKKLYHVALTKESEGAWDEFARIRKMSQELLWNSKRWPV